MTNFRSRSQAVLSRVRFPSRQFKCPFSPKFTVLQEKLLVTLLLRILCFSSAHGFRLLVEWIPQTLNQKADYYSKIADYDDRCVSNNYFCEIDFQWGPFTVDCFASYANTKLPGCYLRSPIALGVDALNHRWKGANC